MYLFTYASLLASLSACVSGLAAPPLITPAARLGPRQGGSNICGYYFDANDLLETLSCDVGACMVATATSPAVGFCSANANDIPITTIYGYGNWPVGGCGPGSSCCAATAPAVGEYLFDSGNTVFLGCGSAPFTFSAFFSEGVTPTPAVFTTQPAQPTQQTQPTQQAQPTSNPTSAQTAASTNSATSSDSTTGIVVIVVAAVVFLVSIIIFCVFASRLFKARWNRKYQPLPGPGKTMAGGNPPHAEGNATRRLGLGATVATIVSAFISAASLGVTVYFATRR